MIALLLLALLLGGYKPATFTKVPELKVPLLLTVRQSVGMAPLSLQVKVRAEAEGREVCVVVEGPESFRSCRQLDGITWTLTFTLRSGGDYEVFATSERYRTPNAPVQVVGIEEQE